MEEVEKKKRREKLKKQKVQVTGGKEKKAGRCEEKGRERRERETRVGNQEQEGRKGGSN